MSTPLKQLISDLQATFRGNPNSAKAVFRSKSRLQQGFRSEVELRDHRLVVDEPAALGGTDTGPNPVELILAALGTCQEITYRAYATALGIELESIAVELEGDLDLRGFLAVAPSVRPGYEQIRGTVRIASTASAEQLQRLRDVVNTHCPVLDILRNDVPVALQLSINGAAAG
jgi:putative redox protein